MELLRDSYFRNSYCFRVILEQLLVCSRGSPWVMSDSTAQSTQRTALVFQAHSQDWASCSISFKVKLFFFPIEKLWAFLQEVFCFGFCINGDRRSRQLTWCPSEVVRSRYGEIKPEADEHGTSCGTYLKLRVLLLSWRIFYICIFTSSWRKWSFGPLSERFWISLYFWHNASWWWALHLWHHFSWCPLLHRWWRLGKNAQFSPQTTQVDKTFLITFTGNGMVVQSWSQIPSGPTGKSPPSSRLQIQDSAGNGISFPLAHTSL